MNALEGYKVESKSIVKGRTTRARNCRGKLDEFLASGNDCMAKRFSDEREANNEYLALVQFSRRNNYPVRVCKRKNAVVLLREDAE